MLTTRPAPATPVTRHAPRIRPRIASATPRIADNGLRTAGNSTVRRRQLTETQLTVVSN